MSLAGQTRSDSHHDVTITVPLFVTLIITHSLQDLALSLFESTVASTRPVLVVDHVSPGACYFSSSFTDKSPGGNQKLQVKGNTNRDFLVVFIANLTG